MPKGTEHAPVVKYPGPAVAVEGRLLGLAHRLNGSEIRITLDHLEDGAVFVRLRMWKRGADGAPFPGQYLCLHPSEIPGMIGALRSALAELRPLPPGHPIKTFTRRAVPGLK